MNSFLPSRNFFGRPYAPADSETLSDFRYVVDAVGVIGLVVILLLVLLGISMIPDLVRYMRIKNM